MDVRNYAVRAELRDGQPVCVRAIRPDDKGRLLDGFGRLSPRSVYLRFHESRKRLSERELSYLTEVDFVHHVALVATVSEDEGKRIIGVGRYVKVEPVSPTRSAELALTVADEHQNLGLGTLLLRHLAGVARVDGMEQFEAEILAENDRVLALLESCGFETRRAVQHGVAHVSFGL